MLTKPNRNKHRLKSLARIIREVNPDIIGIQEAIVDRYSDKPLAFRPFALLINNMGSYIPAGENYFQELLSLLPEYVYSYAHKMNITNKQSEIIGFMSKLPIVESEVLMLPKGRREKACVRCKISMPSGKIELFNLQLDEDLDIQSKQAAEALLFIDRTENRCPQVVLGDFQVQSYYTVPVDILLTHNRGGELDHFKEANSSNLPTFTSWEPRQSFDRILYRNQIVPVNYQVTGYSPNYEHAASTHCTVYADFLVEAEKPDNQGLV